MTIFDDLANAVGVYVGGSAVAGAILAFAVIATIFVCFELIISSTRSGKRGSGLDTLIISFLIGSGFSTIIGWLPIWFPFFIFGGILWLVLDPMGGRASHA